MRSRTILALALLAATGCANFQPAQPPLHRFDNAHDLGVTAIAFSPDGKTLASGGLRGELALWQVSPPDLIARFPAHRDSVRALAFGTQTLLVSSGDDGGLLIWDTQTRSRVAERQSTAVAAMDVATDEIITGHRDGALRVWRFPDLAPLRGTRVGDGIIALARHGAMVAFATDSGRVALYSLALEPQRELQAVGPAAHDLRFSPDGSMLIAGGWFKLLVWDVATGQRRLLPAEHDGLLTSVDFSPDGRRLASLGRHTDSAVRLWDSRQLRVERRYQAHDLCGAMIRFSPDGRHMASASDDESVRLYDLSLPYEPR